MKNQPKLHRCECGRIAEWHYILRRFPSSHAVAPMFNLHAGTRCWAPGQGTIGVQPHVLNPDFANPVTLVAVPVKR